MFRVAAVLALGAAMFPMPADADEWCDTYRAIHYAISINLTEGAPPNMPDAVSCTLTAHKFECEFPSAAAAEADDAVYSPDIDDALELLSGCFPGAKIEEDGDEDGEYAFVTVDTVEFYIDDDGNTMWIAASLAD